MKVFYSSASNNNFWETIYNPREISFDKFHEVTKKPLGYSPAIYADSYRKAKNVKKLQMIILDIDNDDKNLKTFEITEIFKDYTHLIVSTKSHQIDKKGHGVKDRYRIIFPTDNIMTADEYSIIVRNIEKEYELTGAVDSGASNNAAGLFTGNPNQRHRYHYNKTINPFKYYKEPSKLTKYLKNKVLIFSEEDIQIIDAKGEVLDKQQAYMEASDNRKHPCFCPWHTDQTASAFYHIKDEKLGFYCTACEKGKYYKI